MTMPNLLPSNLTSLMAKQISGAVDFYFGQSPEKIHLRNLITQFRQLPNEKMPELISEYRTKIANFYTSLEDPNSPIPQNEREFWKTHAQNALATLNKLSMYGPNALREEDYLSLAPFMDTDPAKRLTQLRLNQYRREVQEKEKQASQAAQQPEQKTQKTNPWEFWKNDDFWNSMMASFIMQLLFRR